MAELQDTSPPRPEKGKTLSYQYPQAVGHRAFHADGFIGSWSALGNLVFDCYIERRAFPDVIVHAIDEEGAVGNEVEVVGGKGAVRERQCSLVLSPGVALSLRDWLTEKLDHAQSIGMFEIHPKEE